MSLRLNRKQFIELIEDTEAGGGDASELRRELEALEPEVKRPTRRNSRVEEEEETTEERLNRRVGDLFPDGIPYGKVIDYDRGHTKNELMEQCRKAGLSISGDKKELAAKIIYIEEEGEHLANHRWPVRATSEGLYPFCGVC